MATGTQQEQVVMSVEEWIFPAGTFEVPVTAFVAVHPLAGASTWAALLDGADAAAVMPERGQVVGVTRSTPAGLAAAKSLVGAHGRERFVCILVVADAPGKPVPEAVRQIKILAGAVPVIQVPWIKQLRGATETELEPLRSARVVAKIRAQLEAFSAERTQ